MSVSANRRFMVIAVLGLVASALAGCKEKSEAIVTPRPALAVELVSPEQRTWPAVILVSGEIAPWDEAVIGAELGGHRIKTVLVNVGDAVHKGQLLATLNDELLRADLRRLDATVLVAVAHLEKAKADAARADKLEKSHAISGQAVETYRTQALVAEAELAAAQANRDAQAINVRNAKIVAPDDGVISNRSATVGTVAPVGGELFRLLRQGRIEWRAEIPDELVPRLRRGAVARLQTPDGGTVEGTLRELSPLVNPATRNGMGYVDLPPATSFAPGMYVAGRFVLSDRSAMVLPESAVVLRDGNRYLMKIDQEGRAREIKIETGRRQDRAVEIIGAIDAADRYVKSGGAFLNDGDLVRVTSTAERAHP